MSNKIETSKISVSKLFEDFWYVIPNYQRHYVWEYEEVRALLDDIYSHYKNNIGK